MQSVKNSQLKLFTIFYRPMNTYAFGYLYLINLYFISFIQSDEIFLDLNGEIVNNVTFQGKDAKDTYEAASIVNYFYSYSFITEQKKMVFLPTTLQQIKIRCLDIMVSLKVSLILSYLIMYGCEHIILRFLKILIVLRIRYNFL